MKVMLVLPVAGASASGIGRYAAQLRRALLSASIPVTPASFRYPPGAKRFQVLQAFPIGIDGPRGDVVHLPQILGSSVLLANRVRRAVVTVHDLGALYCPEDQPLNDWLSRRVLRISLRAMRRAHHVLAVSEFTRGHLVRAGFAPERVTTVHLGVDSAAFTRKTDAASELARRYGLDSAMTFPIVLYVGNEQPRKNLGVLVEALARLRRDGVAFHWIKIGSPVYAPGRDDLLRRIDREGLSGSVTLIDHVPDGDLPFFYSAASVYVQPSLWEGFGLPVLEAMACGTPVVAARAGALPEVCGDAAMFFDPRNSADLAAEIATALTDARRGDDLRRKGVARASSFTWEATAARTRDVYLGLG
jgi:glycosyltransferase involved in cell wall biosynthesis